MWLDKEKLMIYDKEDSKNGIYIFSNNLTKK